MTDPTFWSSYSALFSLPFLSTYCSSFIWTTRALRQLSTRLTTLSYLESSKRFRTPLVPRRARFTEIPFEPTCPTAHYLGLRNKEKICHVLLRYIYVRCWQKKKAFISGENARKSLLICFEGIRVYKGGGRGVGTMEEVILTFEASGHVTPSVRQQLRRLLLGQFFVLLVVGKRTKSHHGRLILALEASICCSTKVFDPRLYNSPRSLFHILFDSSSRLTHV
jgi:hypothetical protein